MVSDELILGSLVHTLEWVEFSCEVAFETVTSLCDKSHDFLSLFLGNAWSEREGLKVTSNTDSGRVDHPIFVSWEVWASKLGVVHVRDVFVAWAVSMVILDDLIEKRCECIKSFVTTSINADAGVGPLASREDALLESISSWVLLVLAFLPDVTGESLGEEGSSS